jgi:hypothetical protein
MADLARAIRHVNLVVHRLLPAERILQLCAESGHRFRRRTLGPVETVLLCVTMILRANVSLATMRIGAGCVFDASSLCRARMRLPLKLLEALSVWVIAAVVRADVPRLLLVDACNYYLPDTRSLRRRYRHPRQKSQAGRSSDYPQMRVLGLFELHTGMLIAQYDFASDRHESCMLRHLLKDVCPGDTLIFDRGFVSFANFCLLRSHGVHVVARLSSNLKAGERGRTRARRRFVNPGRRGSGSVVWDKPARRSDRIAQAAWRRLDPELYLRQVSVKVRHGRSRGRLLLITDLTDVSAKTLAHWYQRRWEIETNFRHLKTTLNQEFFTSRSVEGVKRELLLRMIAHNLVRRVMHNAARRQGVPCRRISFSQATQLLLHGDESQSRNLIPMPVRPRTSRPRRLKYRGRNYPILNTRPRPQRRIA